MLMRYIFCLTLWCAGLLFPSPALRAARSGDGGAFKAVWSAVAPQAPKHEVRAVWLTTIGGIDWPHSYSQSRFSMERQQAELCRLLDLYHRAGINTVLMQTRIRATTIYDAPYEPWDGCLSGFPGRSPGYDALRFAIDECHKRGMELHAWVVTIPVGKWNGEGCRRLRQHLPGVVRRIGTDGYMNPEDPRTGDYLAQLCGDITRRYDIDGIHLDYIRYPETWNIRVGRDAGRACITDIVSKIAREVKRQKPWVKMSCAPIGKHDDLARYRSHGWNAYTRVCQDAQGWLRQGLMDALFPMMYFRNEQFFPFAIDWAEHSAGRIVAPGLGIYFLDPREGNWRLDDIVRQMNELRHLGLGHTFFRGKFLTDDVQGIYRFVSRRFNLYPALVPPMTWESRDLPPAPTDLLVRRQGATLQLSWHYRETEAQRLMPPGVQRVAFNVYASTSSPVDIGDARNLIATRLPHAAMSLPAQAGGHLRFAITAIDRYGNESLALQSAPADSDTDHAPTLLRCDGYRLEVPAGARMADTGLLLIESLQGQTVASRSWRGSQISVADIAPGIYVLRSINRKGVTHRLGYFIKRPHPRPLSGGRRQ